MNRILIVTGAVLVLVGLIWPLLKQFGLGRLPGDIFIHRDGFQLYLPLVTCLVVSIVISLIFWLINR